MIQSTLSEPVPARPVRIDAHHHLWNYSSTEYDWISDEMQVLRHDFLPDDLESVLEAAHLDGSIVVQARQTLAETKWLLSLANSNAKIFGVVGWAPIADSSFPELLEKLRQQSKLVGLRHVVQAEPAGFLEGAAFNQGISRLQSTGLVYDLLIYEHQMSAALSFVDRHPKQSFVLDHCAKPHIASQELEPWRMHLHELARRPNVTCKLSGLVTEANWESWTLETLTPYLDAVLEAFGAERLMAGSDWPVCLLATTCERWWRTLSDYCAQLSRSEQAQIMGLTAERIYQLKLTKGLD
ncbi:MAG: amidohydrolase family protein [Granulicella sp.]